MDLINLKISIFLLGYELNIFLVIVFIDDVLGKNYFSNESFLVKDKLKGKKLN
jgi:hypothetical protein